MQQALCVCALIVWQELCYVRGKEVKEESYKLNFPPGVLQSGERESSKWFTMIKKKDKYIEIQAIFFGKQKEK